MIDSPTFAHLREAIADCIDTDRSTLDQLRQEIRPLRGAVHPIRPRATTSISIVGADGGNNQIRFDPFLIQLVRVVDSSNNEYCLEAVSPTTPIEKLDARQFSRDGTPITALGEMMSFLGVTTLTALSNMIRPNPLGKPVSPTWVRVYRELVEWATLFSILKKDFGTDTLIVYDGLLRSVVFSTGLFQRLLRGMKERIVEQWERSRRRIYLAGLAKNSKVLTRYRLAMSLEGVLQTDYPAFVEVDREIEERAYIRPEFARGEELVAEDADVDKFAGGKMFLAKFGRRRHDPIWPVDIFLPQRKRAQTILGSILADTVNGFPVPHYPSCLQKAHENAALVDFDFDVLQDYIFDGFRASLKHEAATLDVFQLQDADPTQRRYE